MAQARIKVIDKVPFARQIAPPRRQYESDRARIRLAGLSEEFKRELDALKTSRILETSLKAMGGLVLVAALFAGMAFGSQSCTYDPATQTTLLIGSAFKIAGC